MAQYGSSLRGVEYTQQVGLPTAEIDDIFQGDNEFLYAGDDQDFASGYDATAGQWFWRLPSVVAPNEPIINIFNGVIGETVTTPAAGVLANTENTIVVWGGTGAVASYTFLQGGIGVTSGTTRFRALANSLGVDIDINVVTPVIDIGADVFATGTFIDIAYDTAETLTGALTGLNIDLDTNVTGGSQIVLGLVIVIPSTGISTSSSALDITGTQNGQGLIDINPSGTTTGNVIDITPTAALTAGVIWAGIEIDGGALDPLTGGETIIYGANFDFSLVASADGDDAFVIGYRARLPRVDSSRSVGFQYDMQEQDLNGDRIGFQVLSSIAASFTATYRGFFIEWNSVTRTAQAPVLEGIRIDWPAATTSFGTSFPFILTDGTNTLMTITMATEIANLIAIAPRGTGSQNVIDLTPAVALAAGTVWQGIFIDGTALDPLTGAGATIRGSHVDFSGIVSADSDAQIIAHLVQNSATDSSHSFRHDLVEITNTTTTRGFVSLGGSLALSTSATYRGLHVDWDTVTRDANAPIIEGIRIDWPASTTSFGTSQPFILTDGTNTLMHIDFATNQSELINLQPRGTITQSVIVIEPLVAIAAGTQWTGFEIDGDALDPLTGAATIIFGTDFDFEDVVSADGDDADLAGHRVRLPSGDTNTTEAFLWALTEMTVAGRQTGFKVQGGTTVLSATATYRGYRVDFNNLTRDAGSPVIEGIRIDWPATVLNFGTSTPFILTDGTNTWMTILPPDGTIAHATLRILDSGGTDYIQFFDDDSVAWIVANPNGIAIAPSNDVDDYILFSTISNVPGFTSIGAADLDIQNQAVAAVFDATFFANQTDPGTGVMAAGEVPEIRIYGWNHASTIIRFNVLRTISVAEGINPDDDEVAYFNIGLSTDSRLLIITDHDETLTEVTAAASNPMIRLYDAGGTDYIGLFHDDTEAQLHATHGLFRFQDVADTDDSNALTINVSDALGGAGTEHVSMSIGAVEVLRLLDTGIIASNALDGGADPGTAELTVFDLYDDLELLESWANNRLNDLPDDVITKNQNNNGYWLNQTNVNRLLRDTIRQIANKYENEIQSLKTQLNDLTQKIYN